MVWYGIVVCMVCMVGMDGSGYTTLHCVSACTVLGVIIGATTGSLPDRRRGQVVDRSGQVRSWLGQVRSGQVVVSAGLGRGQKASE
jgi:hypothetical protein